MLELEVLPLSPLEGAEVVERKGVGHPDTVADALADALSRALCREYRSRFGAILHHNVDKALLVGGASAPRFGGGAVVEPVEVLLAGRATTAVGDARVDLDGLVHETVTGWLKTHLRFLDAERHVRIGHRIRAGSADLTGLFARGEPLANDTSFGVGHAPRSRLERTVLAVDAALAEERTHTPALGEDLKVMGVARGGRLELTVAIAMVDRFLADARAYEDAKARVLAIVGRVAPEAPVVVNTADDPARAQRYLTVTGTSLEAGDDGQVGRGNRLSGLITPCRPMSLEATAGKNPVTHVGKLYNVLARRVAERLTQRAGVLEATCLLVSRIGKPVREPWFAQVRIRSEGSGGVDPEHAKAAREELDRALSELPAVTEALIDGSLAGY
ncbi:MAG: methionine adenosyltransferase [Myxococcaceae bacterium]|nr:methionine adenosyltransferase [Myxococcaceae bacterium]